MEKIWYFGQNKKEFGLLKRWLGKDYQLVQASDPIAYLLRNQHSDIPELMLISLEYITEGTIETLMRNIEQTAAEQLPALIWINHQSSSENPEETVPAAIWQSDAVDIVFKPLSEKYIRKKIELALQYKKSAIDCVLAEKTMETCKRENSAAVDQLKQSALENEALLQEIHHRVKNNLQIVSSILSFKTDEFDDPRVQDVLMTARSRVDAISLIHKKLYESNNLAKIKMHDYIEQQMSDLFYNYPKRSSDIELNIDIIPFTLEVTPAIQCALLINELVVNVFLHAFQGKSAGHLIIRVENHHQNQLRLIIEDDGVGIKGNPEEIGTKSIGMRLIYQLVRQMNGAIHYQGGSGTRFEIIFPKSL
ncbi:MAG: sensor histidine kinase [SAR324 cluster bacterium]|nr:sensor histidine kinase [SAR324 cluster bacterium]